jgi:hypothetical protein
VKDRLRTAWWRNLFPKNPTQQSYRRFVRGPGAQANDAFTKSQREFRKALGKLPGSDILKEV